MKGTKRRRSRSPTISRKVSRLSDEEEDLESILRKIHQQEESEALAKKLQQEYEELSGEDAVVDLTTDQVVVDLTEDDEVRSTSSVMVGFSMHEDDEAMARRLAREWGESDAMETSTNIAEDKSVVRMDQNSNSTGSKSSPNLRTAPANLDAHSATPQDELLISRDMFIQSRACTTCGTSVASPRNLVVFSATIPPPTLLALLHCVCDACGQSHCRGCFRALTCPKNCKGKRCSVADCCAEVRAIALFEALGGFDRQYIGERMNASDENKKPKYYRSKVATVGPGGTGYSADSHKNYERGRHNSEDKTQLEDRMAADASKAVAARWDDVVLRALDTITWLLPSPYSDSAAPYDLLPHPSIRSLVSISYLPELLGRLLINDSVTDWTERSDVYNSMMKLLRRMADSELSVGTLINERLEKIKSAGIEDWMWGDGTIEWERNPGTGDIIRAPPLFDHFEKLTKQCEIFLAGASHLLEDGDDSQIEDVTIRATSLCGDMISAQQDMQRALSVMIRSDQGTTTGKGKGRDRGVDMEKRYCAKCEELAFKHVALSSDSSSAGLSYPGYHYIGAVKETQNSTRQPSKRLHLVRELSVLSTSLPPGVWIRVDEVRNDIIKIMIAGPEDTPYAGGLFEFDCFLPLEYPEVSPKMNLCTTASGQVRFNPNLYADGKVCLSLLGTWPGRPEEEWSRKSTLLQVIVSIQSMILVDAPFFNEPGYGQAKLSDQRSVKYNKNIALQTVRWAMVDWMQDKHQDGIWGEVIANHFSIRREKILGCIRTWAKDDARFQNYNSSSTRLAGMYTTESSHWGYGRQSASAEVGEMDLLDEFERGCKRVRGWLGHQ